MPGIQKLKEVERLPATDFAEDDSVRPMAKSCSQEIPNRHCRQSVLRLPGLKPNQILLPHVNLGRVLNQQNSFLLRDELSEDVQEGRFAHPVPPAMRMFLRPNT